MPSDYRLVQTNADEKWDKLIEDSLNGTLFSNSTYLKSSKANYKLYYCYKKNELRAGVALIEGNTSRSAILNDLIIYNGIIYNKPTSGQNHAQQSSEQYKIQEFISIELTNLYSNIEMSLHPSIVDIRGMLWVNYGTKLSKYNPSIRYTSHISISDFKASTKLEDISTYNKASTSRRQQIRYAIKKKYETKNITDSKFFVEFYKKTMCEKRLEIEENKLQIMEQLISTLIKNNMAKIYASYDELNEIGSMAFFGWDNKRAYYIFGANDPTKKDGHSGTNVLWEAFYDLSKMGINEVDLEGINSPYRGWFKLSFGGDILPYYEVTLKEVANGK
jgi:hypothetical protein